jgi:LysM repeat protein
MSLLVACPGQANCYLYTVRGAGPAPAGNGSGVADTLQGIANYFGVDVAKIRQMNTSLATSDVIHPGDKLKIPPPTR